MSRAKHESVPLALRATRVATRLYPFLPWLGRIPRLFRTAHAFPTDDSSLLTTHGITVRLRADPMWGSLWRQRVYEPFATKVFRRLVGSGDTVFDVGANFGWFTALFAKWVGASGSVHAFEPVPSIAEMAAETLQLSSLEARVQLNRIGLSARAGAFTVYTFDGLPLGHASGSDLGRSDARAHACSVTTLDEYVYERSIKRSTFMKLDVEGYELDVLEGGRRFLESDGAPVIYFETNTECLDNRKLRAQAIVDLLRASGYSRFCTFNIRDGFRERTHLPDNAHGDHLAFKPIHSAHWNRAIHTGRVLRSRR
jgi:FkbM family methyltransferase